MGSITSLSTKPETDTNEDTGEVTKWNAYRFMDSGLSFKEKYILPGQELRIAFQSGKLNGFDFAVWFNPDKKDESSLTSQVFEIVRSEDYGSFLPNDTIKPSIGDKYILYGFDIQLVADQYVPAAEQELYDKAVEWMNNQLKDKSVYSCPTVINHFAEKELDLELGQKVKLISPLFDEGFRISRIMGFEKKLINIYNATYQVGDNAIYSRLAQIEKEVEELKYAGDIYQSTGNGSGVYLIKQHDTTTPTDFNAYSAKAANSHFLKRDQEDSALKKITFQDGIDVKKGATSDLFGNTSFTSGQFGSGFRIWKDANNGQSYAEFDNLMVRREMIINTLTIAEIKSVGGQILLSLANMLCSKVEVLANDYKCYFDTDGGTIVNQFAVNDQVICRKFNSKGIKYYWRRVTAIGSDYIQLSKTDCDGSGIPAKDDEIIQFGNRTDINRQSAIMISAYGFDAPSIKQYSGINSYNLTGKEATVISPKGNKFTGTFEVKSGNSNVRVPADRGNWSSSVSYNYYDRVSYNGALWLCLVPEGQTTIQTPSENSVYWRKETTSQGDINNAIGNIQIGARNYVLNSKEIQQSATTSAFTFKIIPLSENLQPNTEYTLSIEKTEITSGTVVPSFTVIAYNLSTNSSGNNITFPISNTRQSVTFKTGNLPNNGYTLLFYTGIVSGAANRSLKWTEVILEKANKPSTWRLADEDIQAGIDQAKSDAAKAQTSADQAKTNVTSLNSYVDGAFKDGVIDSSEAKAIEKYFNTLKEIMSGVEASYSKVYANSYLEGLSKTGLYNAKNALNTANTNLVNAINSAIADGKTTVAEKQDVDNKFTSFNAAIKTYQEALEEANKSIQTKLDSLSKGYAATAQAAADAAKAAADKAQADANSANSKLSDISNDNILDVPEKQNVLKEWQIIQGEYSTIIAQAATYSVSSSDYASKYNSLSSYISPLLTNLTVNSVIVGTTFRSTFKNYYDAKISLLKTITDKAKSLADAAQSTANGAQTAANNAQNAADQAKNLANMAQSTANDARTNAATANTLLSDIANDNKLVATEKQSTQKEWDAIKSEYPKNVAHAQSFGINSSAYSNSYNSLNSYITPLLSNLNVTTDIVGTTFRNTFKTYYDTRLDLLNAIAQKAKDLADAAQNAANGAITRISFAESSITKLDNEIKLTVKQSDFNSLQGRVSSTESNIIQQADRIAQTVEKVNNKSSVFKSAFAYDYPKPPYAKNDLWIKLDGEMRQANTNRLTGSFVESDWIKVENPDLNNLQIGGRNLVRNSGNWRNAGWNDGYTSNGGGFTVLAETYNGMTLLETLAGAGLSHSWLKLENNTEYTYSALVKCNETTIGTTSTPLHYWAGLNNQNQGKISVIKCDSSVVANIWKKIYIVFKLTGDADSFRPFFYRGNNGTTKYWIAYFKLEKGNHATDWTPAPEDVQSGVDQAQSTADSKNRTFYSDIQPSTPNGGFSVGDIWYKMSLIDGCYVTYRWLWDYNKGKYDWIPVNVSASKTRIEQTDSQINLIATKEERDSIGAGKSLIGQIKVKADEIDLSVKGIQIGARNYVLNSKEIQQSATTSAFTFKIIPLSENLQPNTEYTLSIEKTEITSGTVVPSFTVIAYNLSTNSSGNNITFPISNTRQSVTFKTGNLPNNGYTLLFYTGIVSGAANRSLKWTEVILEKANKPSTWRLADEDIPDMVGSRMSIKENRIYIGSKDIVLDGNTIAKAIQAGSLDVGNGNFRVGQDGIISAKGANIEGKYQSAESGRRTVIDPLNGRVSLYDNSGIENIALVGGMGSTSIWLAYGSTGTRMRLTPFGVSIYKINETNPCIEFTSDGINIDNIRLIIKNLPTSNIGLAIGQLWRDGEIIKIKT